MSDPTTSPAKDEQPIQSAGMHTGGAAFHLRCDRCGVVMVELQCKIICLNCGSRFDCSDLNIYLE